MAQRSCPRCGEVVEYVGDANRGQVCPICGERAAGDAPPVAWSSTAVSATPAPPPIVTGTDDEPSMPPPAPAYTLASAGQVGLATFLGGPMAGWLLIARNYAKLGRRGAWFGTLVAGVLATAATVAVLMLLPEQTGGAKLLPAVVSLAITYGCAQFLQGATLQEHMDQGGQNASGWVVLGSVVLGLVLLIGPLIGGFVLYEVVLGDQTLAFSAKEDILHGRNVPVEEARTLGLVLQADGFFDGVNEKTVVLHKEGDEYVVMFVLRSGFQDAEMHEYFRTLARQISQAFEGKPVRVELCDAELTVKKTLPAVRAGQ